MVGYRSRRKGLSKTAQKASLAGRIYEFVLPLVDIFNLEELKELYLQKERISPLFISYLKKGGFIEIAIEEDDLKIGPTRSLSWRG